MFKFVSKLADRISSIVSQGKPAKSATKSVTDEYPHLLSGDSKAALVQLRPMLLANIAVMAEADHFASILVTENYVRSVELKSILATLEMDDWTVQTRTVSPSEIRSCYGFSFDGGNKVERSVESTNTTLFDQLLEHAIDSRADEIRYHVREKTCGVVHLIDGSVYPAESLKAQAAIELLANAFTNLADQSSYERGKTEFSHSSIDQSCTILRVINGGKYKLRYATVPEADGGFDVTMRILRQGEKGQVPTLPSLGFVPSFIRMVTAALERRRGMILVCGPVGGGKTTLLYSMLFRPQDKRDRYVVTIEDPVEYEQYGITRIPVEKIGHEDLEKKILRMGVHWAMVGEVRDKKMGRMVKVLAATGQKVLTTTHVLSVSQIIDRLTGDEIGISRQTLCDTDMVAAMIYTCLVPKICPHCAIEATQEGAMSPHHIQQLQRLEIPLDKVRVANRSGCSQCKGGRRGRQPVTELVIPDEKYMRLMREGADGDAKEYWLNSCVSHVTDEDVTGKPMMATALYWLSQGLFDVHDLEREIDRLETFTPRVTRSNVVPLKATS